jgi:Peptidase of plants and bacteria
MRTPFVLMPLALLVCAACWLRADEKPATIDIRLDVSQAPEMKDWGEKAQKLCVEWYPKILTRLESKDKPRPVTLVFKKDKKGIAWTVKDTITISADWIKKHPDDFGMVIHELTHVVQAYPANDAGWLVEGIADYIRYHHFEPRKGEPHVDAKSSYKEGYGTAAAFLAWVEKTQDKTIIVRLNTALHDGKYKPEIFKDATGKDLDALWAAYVKAHEKK